MNQVAFSGRAVSDIEMRFTPAGKGVASGTMAVRRNFKNAQGEYESDFIDFVQWGDKPAEVMSKYIAKGDYFEISGEMRTRIYEKEGIKRKVSEVHVEKFSLPQRPKSQGSSENRNTGQRDPFSGQPIDISESDLPF